MWVHGKEKVYTFISSIPIKTVAVTTAAFPRNKMKSPTELIAATRKTLFAIILKARPADQQKFSP